MKLIPNIETPRTSLTRGAARSAEAIG